MTALEALILGTVEGVTEYLPVSSTAHILLVSRLMGLQNAEGNKAFNVVVQSGAILAVLGVYSRAIVDMCRGLVGKSPGGLRLALRLLIALAITSVFALALEKRVEDEFSSLWVCAGSWIVGGLVILVIEARRKHWPTGLTLADLSLGGAAGIGLLQAVSICPGVSRSLVTLIGGLLVGLSFSAALEFSFLLGGVTLFAATGWKLRHFAEMRQDIGASAAAIALAAAAISAWLCVRWMLRSLEKYGLMPFGWYRIALGLAVFALLAAGAIQPK